MTKLYKREKQINYMRYGIFIVMLFIAVFALPTFADSTQQYNKIFLTPFYVNNLAGGTAQNFSINLNPPDHISSVVSGIVSFNAQINGQTQNFTLLMNGKSCNPSSYTIATAFSTTGNVQFSFDCTNIMKKEGIYVVTLVSAVNTGSISGWLDLTYMNNPQIALTIHGTEYVQGDNATVFVQVPDFTVNQTLCTNKVYYPNVSVFRNTGMLFVQNSNGLFYDNFIAPNFTGVYMVETACYTPLIIATFPTFFSKLNLINSLLNSTGTSFVDAFGSINGGSSACLSPLFDDASEDFIVSETTSRLRNITNTTGYFSSSGALTEVTYNYFTFDDATNILTQIGSVGVNVTLNSTFQPVNLPSLMNLSIVIPENVHFQAQVCVLNRQASSRTFNFAYGGSANASGFIRSYDTLNVTNTVIYRGGGEVHVSLFQNLTSILALVNDTNTTVYGLKTNISDLDNDVHQLNSTLIAVNSTSNNILSYLQGFVTTTLNNILSTVQLIFNQTTQINSTVNSLKLNVTINLTVNTTTQVISVNNVTTVFNATNTSVFLNVTNTTFAPILVSNVTFVDNSTVNLTVNTTTQIVSVQNTTVIENVTNTTVTTINPIFNVTNTTVVVNTTNTTVTTVNAILNTTNTSVFVNVTNTTFAPVLVSNVTFVDNSTVNLTVNTTTQVISVQNITVVENITNTTVTTVNAILNTTNTTVVVNTTNITFAPILTSNVTFVDNSTVNITLQENETTIVTPVFNFTTVENLTNLTVTLNSTTIVNVTNTTFENNITLVANVTLNTTGIESQLAEINNTLINVNSTTTQIYQNVSAIQTIVTAMQSTLNSIVTTLTDIFNTLLFVNQTTTNTLNNVTALNVTPSINVLTNFTNTTVVVNTTNTTVVVNSTSVNLTNTTVIVNTTLTNLTSIENQISEMNNTVVNINTTLNNISSMLVPNTVYIY